MFDNNEIKSLRQDVDALSEQVSMLIETIENRHAEIMARLDVMDEKLGQIRDSDLEAIKTAVEDVKMEVSGVSEAVQTVEEHLSEEE